MMAPKLDNIVIKFFPKKLVYNFFKQQPLGIGRLCFRSDVAEE
jgi:hypothetical protein